MTLSKNNVSKLSDVVSLINTNIRSKILEKVDWHKNSIPSHTPPAEGESELGGTFGNSSYSGTDYAKFFDTVSSIKPINFDTIENTINSSVSINSQTGAATGIAHFGQIYSGIREMFIYWSKVRTCNARFVKGQYSGKENPTYDEKYKVTTKSGVAILASKHNGIINAISNKQSLLNTLMKAADLKTFVNSLYNIWDQLKDTYSVEWEHIVCHSNCHNNCHKSGGRR